MKKEQILIIGSGGREHAIGKHVIDSRKNAELFFMPGNGGTRSVGTNLAIKADDVYGIVDWVKKNKPTLTLVGPEAPLALGLVDRLTKNGFLVFGPTKEAARIETSKVFAKHFMKKYNIPTARFETFSSFELAKQFIYDAPFDVVVKASGLAGGKGVIVPENKKEALSALDRIMNKHEFGSAGNEVVIEERMRGAEVSLMVFTDGVTVKPMISAQDHKRIFDNDKGPNTGGMGAYGPIPFVSSAMVKQITKTILQPTIDGLKKEGKPFVGVLYAGLMLTSDGPKVVEFNCRFGDPETQVVLPLLRTDLIKIAQACVSKRLTRLRISWKKGFAASVVLASKGYPEKSETGQIIQGIEKAEKITGVTICHAGTKNTEGHYMTSGGRVLAVTGVGSSLLVALKKAYAAVKKIRFSGMQYRTDIGIKGLKK
ncbi:phosphoribosylamine--glycine ligase [Candidatus Gottesmanbacteria bacterium]|nr:phosphoribosylamine--glycine ligase [Candidatus Gottesmanbacteria bacterium]